jgi:hypothetical protein
MTNNFTQNSQVTDRVNKSCGFNVGWGPLWEMVEDRGWYKEAVEGVDGMDNDAGDGCVAARGRRAPRGVERCQRAGCRGTIGERDSGWVVSG